MIIDNLIMHKLVHTGTWVGVCDGAHSPITRMVVEHTLPGQLVATLAHTHTQITVPTAWVVEVEGMTVHRFLDQAGLDAHGMPMINVKKRGRKPKIRT